MPTEFDMRLQQFYDASRTADFHVIHGNWAEALYHVDTQRNLLLALILEQEREAMRKEREAAEDDYERHETVQKICQDW